MTAYRRNVVVGLTVLVSLAGLTGMLLKFGGAPLRLFHRGQVDINLRSERADGLSEGGRVMYQGVSVGRIARLRRSHDGKGVIIDATIDTDPPLPATVHGIIRQVGLIGGTAEISLEVFPDSDAGKGQLADGAQLEAKFVGNEIIPHQFSELATQIGKATEDVDKYVADPKVKTDIQTTLDNFRRISESAGRSAGNIEQFSDQLQSIGGQATDTLGEARRTIAETRADIAKEVRQLDDRMLQLSKTLDTVQAVVAKIDAGQGTAGLLVNDPKLYDNLAETTRQLNGTVASLKRLVDQWEQEGISFKLK